MAIKRPLVNNAGTTGELTVSDTLAPAALGTGTANAGAVLRGDGAWSAMPRITVSSTAPVSPAVNDLWVEI